MPPLAAAPVMSYGLPATWVAAGAPALASDTLPTICPPCNPLAANSVPTKVNVCP